MKARLFTLCTALCLLAAPLLAESTADIRRRMEQRLPAIDDLKARAIVGENNQGYLEMRGAGSAQDGSTVGAENSDRRQVYAEIARQTGTSADTVGRARAKKIAENSRPGVWLQRESGEWYRK